jgi:hypothetical protein
MALCSPILALGQYKRAKEMSYEYLDTRKCCHATLWILRTFADHLCGILKVEHFFAFEERFRGPKEIQ